MAIITVFSSLQPVIQLGCLCFSVFGGFDYLSESTTCIWAWAFFCVCVHSLAVLQLAEAKLNVHCIPAGGPCPSSALPMNSTFSNFALSFSSFSLSLFFSSLLPLSPLSFYFLTFYLNTFFCLVFFLHCWFSSGSSCPPSAPHPLWGCSFLTVLSNPHLIFTLHVFFHSSIFHL